MCFFIIIILVLLFCFFWFFYVFFFKRFLWYFHQCLLWVFDDGFSRGVLLLWFLKLVQRVLQYSIRFYWFSFFLFKWFSRIIYVCLDSFLWMVKATCLATGCKPCVAGF